MMKRMNVYCVALVKSVVCVYVFVGDDKNVEELYRHTNRILRMSLDDDNKRKPRE